MNWDSLLIALIAGLPGIITSISSFRNGGKLKTAQKSLNDLNGKVVTIPAPIPLKKTTYPHAD
jgi:hypothetical protein